MKKFIAAILPFIVAACSQSRHVNKTSYRYDKAMADSMIAYALDHEALYSLVDTLKPVSSVKFLSYAVAKDSTHTAVDFNIVKNIAALDTIDMYQRICKRLSTDKVKLVMIPFERYAEGKRHLEIYAVNMQKFRNKIHEYSSFFGQFGITTSSDPAQVITIIEYEKKYDRWRGYGYLFGYPSYAVDFFVVAGQQQDSTKQFVKRKFFQIPVYAASEGYFTYAMPEDRQPGMVDSTLYYNALKVLSRYQSLRDRYQTPAGMKATELWRKMLNN